MANRRKREKRSVVAEAESQIQNLSNFWPSMPQEGQREFLNPGRSVQTHEGRPPMFKKAALDFLHLAAHHTQIGNLFLNDKQIGPELENPVGI